MVRILPGLGEVSIVPDVAVGDIPQLALLLVLHKTGESNYKVEKILKPE